MCGGQYCQSGDERERTLTANPRGQRDTTWNTLTDTLNTLSARYRYRAGEDRKEKNQREGKSRNGRHGENNDQRQVE